MAWLAAEGLPVPSYRWVEDAAAAARACAELGYPVVMKVVSPDILHKSDAGGVRLNITDDAAARAAFAALAGSAERAGARFCGAVIYPMVHDAVEAIVGLARDPQFGPVVLFGLGGIFTEVLRDVVVRVAPLDHERALAMVRALRAFPLLAGARGQAPRGLPALADLLVRVSALPFRYPELGELDLNPVFLLSRGGVIGDVRVIRRPTHEEVHREVL